MIATASLVGIEGRPLINGYIQLFSVDSGPRNGYECRHSAWLPESCFASILPALFKLTVQIGFLRQFAQLDVGFGVVKEE